MSYRSTLYDPDYVLDPYPGYDPFTAIFHTESTYAERIEGVFKSLFFGTLLLAVALGLLFLGLCLLYLVGEGVYNAFKLYPMWSTIVTVVVVVLFAFPGYIHIKKAGLRS